MGDLIVCFYSKQFVLILDGWRTYVQKEWLRINNDDDCGAEIHDGMPLNRVCQRIKDKMPTSSAYIGY
jgi:hypothetical protein